MRNRSGNIKGIREMNVRKLESDRIITIVLLLEYIMIGDERALVCATIE